MSKELTSQGLYIPDERGESNTNKRAQGNITSVVNSVNDLRNDCSSAHGREGDYEGLSGRHARLIVGI